MKLTRRLIVVGLAATLLAACGGGSGGDGDENSIRYSWWGAGERNERTNAVVDLFEQANPDVTVNREIAEFASHFERLTVQAAANDAPCVPQMQSYVLAEHTSRNHFMPLDDLVEDGTIDVSGVPDFVVDTGRGEDGQLYMIPTGMGNHAVFYNVDIMSEAGLEPPTPDWTWDEFDQYVRDASEQMPEGVHTIELEPGASFKNLLHYVIANGQEPFVDGKIGFDEAVLVDWLTMWNNLLDDGVTITQAMASERPQSNEEGYLSNGRIMMNIQGDNQLVQYDAITSENGAGQLTSVKLPHGPDSAGEWIWTNGLTISRSCENVEAAAAFIDFFLNDPEAADAYSSSNGLVTVDEFQTTQRENEDAPESLRHVIGLAQTLIEEHEPEAIVFPPGTLAAEEAFTRHFESMYLGDETPQSAASAFITEANSLLSTN